MLRGSSRLRLSCVHGLCGWSHGLYLHALRRSRLCGCSCSALSHRHACYGCEAVHGLEWHRRCGGIVVCELGSWRNGQRGRVADRINPRVETGHSSRRAPVSPLARRLVAVNGCSSLRRHGLHQRGQTAAGATSKHTEHVWRRTSAGSAPGLLLGSCCRRPALLCHDGFGYCAVLLPLRVRSHGYARRRQEKVC